MSGFLY